MSAPVPFALVGLGFRAQKLYLPLFEAVAPWLRLSAVCTPNAGKAEWAEAQLGVPAFTSVPALVDAGLAEAALVLSTIESHHAISTYLSRHGIHHLVETAMCSLLGQAEDMAAAARENGVKLVVAENYFRFPFDRLAKRVVRSGAIGTVGRVTCFHDQPGFHGTARWIKFFESAPEAVQAINHTMTTERHVESPRRIHDGETWRTSFLHFPGERLAIDMGGNSKGMLGRSARPGHTEICGSRGAIVRESGAADPDSAHVRVCSDRALLENPGQADFVAAFRNRIENGVWLGSHTQTPAGPLAFENQSRPPAIEDPKLRPWDGAVVMAMLTEFTDCVRGDADPEFSLEDALATMQAEAALAESAHAGGRRVELPVVAADLATERRRAEALRARLGADPFNGPALLGMHFPPAA